VGLLLQIAVAAVLFGWSAMANAEGSAAGPFECPAELRRATQLLLVSAKAMSSKTGIMRRFERAGASPWLEIGGATPVVLGFNGIRWAWSSGGMHDGGPVKREGDGATPAGVFPVGAPFGFDAAALPGYVRLRPGKQFCVNEPEAPSYNTIVSHRPAGVSGEDMGRVHLYRRGFFVEYPTNRRTRGGSCTFIHVWHRPDAATAGCVALSEENVTALHYWVRPKEALIAILPDEQAHRLEMCFNNQEG
jgi:L,D-peptidoglycan transpeptidase YkuD (ErfK/YbiS/YcfS/YnhG family)